jgi:L-threonylcarbamoyladenylate synthase
MPSDSQLQQAANIIKTGGVISYPTESVFGLGCDPLCETAVNQILQLKQRSVDKGLILLAGDLQQLIPYIEITDKEKQSILNEKATMTWLVRKSDLTPSWVSGKHNKVAVRISQHPLVISLCKELDQAIISTSANPAGKLPALSCKQSRDYFTDKISMYLDHDTKINGKPTPIKDIETGQTIR